VGWEEPAKNPARESKFSRPAWLDSSIRVPIASLIGLRLGNENKKGNRGDGQDCGAHIPGALLVDDPDPMNEWIDFRRC